MRKVTILRIVAAILCVVGILQLVTYRQDGALTTIGRQGITTTMQRARVGLRTAEENSIAENNIPQEQSQHHPRTIRAQEQAQRAEAEVAAQEQAQRAQAEVAAQEQAQRAQAEVAAQEQAQRAQAEVAAQEQSKNNHSSGGGGSKLPASPPNPNLNRGHQAKFVVEFGIAWRFCSRDGLGCMCESGVVRYGIPARWFVTTLTNSFRPFPCPHRRECWCKMPGGPQQRPANVGLALKSKRVEKLPFWINYHIEHVGVKHIFVEVSGTPLEWNATLQNVKDPQKISMRFGKNSEINEHMRLQIGVVDWALRQSPSMGVDWVVGVDDDELLYLPSQRKIGDVFGNVPLGYEQMWLPNVEALYESTDILNCFSQAKFANTNPRGFVGYGNGKCGARTVLKDGVRPKGSIHVFFKPGAGGKDVLLGTMDVRNEADAKKYYPFGQPIFIVHYDSCPFEAWKETYRSRLQYCDPHCFQYHERFPFQHRSLILARECARSPSNELCSKTNMKKFWASYKLRSERELVDVDILLPLHIPAFAK